MLVARESPSTTYTFKVSNCVTYILYAYYNPTESINFVWRSLISYNSRPTFSLFNFWWPTLVLQSFYKEKAKNGPGQNDDDNNNNKKKNTLLQGETFSHHLSALRIRAKFKDKIMVMDIGMNLAPVIKSWGIIVW